MVDVCSGFRYWYSHVISSAWPARIPPMTGTTTMMIRDSLRVPLFTDIVSIDVDDDATQTRHTLLADPPTTVDLMHAPEWSRPRVRHTTGSVCRRGSPVPRGSRAPRRSRRRRNSAASGVSGTRPQALLAVCVQLAVEVGGWCRFVGLVVDSITTNHATRPSSRRRSMMLMPNSVLIRLSRYQTM